MKRVLSWLRTRLFQTKRFFAHSKREVERTNIGLGQFVLLLSLTPFIFSLTLYDIGSTGSVASKYLINPDRYDDLSFNALGSPAVQLDKELLDSFKRLNVTAERVCSKKLNPSERVSREWLRNKRIYILLHKLSVEECKEYLYGKRNKPTPPKTEVIETSQSHFSLFQKKIALTAVRPLVGANIDQDKKAHSSNIYIDRIVNASSFQVITYPLWLLCFLLLFPIIAICIKRRAWGLLVCGLSVPAVNYVLYIFSSLLSFEWLTILPLQSPFFAQIAFAWFLIRGHIISRAFMVFIIMLMISTLIPTVVSGLSLIDPAYVNHEDYSILKAQLPILIFFCIACVGRLLVKGARENTVLLRELGFLPSLKLAVHALILWLPMALLCLPFFYLSEVLFPKTITNELHENRILQFDYQHEEGFLDNALHSTAHISDDVNFVWHLSVEEIKANLAAKNRGLQNTNFKSVVAKRFDDVVPEELKFDEPDSGVFLFGWLVDAATEQTQDSINKSYVDLKNQLKEHLLTLVAEQEENIRQKAKQGTDAASDHLNDLKLLGKGIIVANNTTAQSTIWWSLNYLNAAHQLALLVFAFVCVKSFMYVFARVSFNQNTGTIVTLGDSRSTYEIKPEPKIKATGLEYVIDSSLEETYFITRRYQCRGKPPNLSIPQAFHAPFARLFNKAYTMNKIVMQAGDCDVSCTATKGIEFFEWHLSENEKVIFDFHNFVGMTEDLKISTLISPRISSLLLGKMIFSQATGPGKLVLMAKGRAEICDSAIKVGSLPPERIIAMLLDTKLHIDSELDILNIYLSTAHVRPVCGQMIVDVDSQRGAKAGLVSFVKHFIFPG